MTHKIKPYIYINTEIRSLIETVHLDAKQSHAHLLYFDITNHLVDSHTL